MNGSKRVLRGEGKYSHTYVVLERSVRSTRRRFIIWKTKPPPRKVDHSTVLLPGLSPLRASTGGKAAIPDGFGRFIIALFSGISICSEPWTVCSTMYTRRGSRTTRDNDRPHRTRVGSVAAICTPIRPANASETTIGSIYLVAPRCFYDGRTTRVNKISEVTLRWKKNYIDHTTRAVFA